MFWPFAKKKKPTRENPDPLERQLEEDDEIALWEEEEEDEDG